MELILTSIIAFASTNVDDIFILMLFFANREYSGKQIVAGQYLGILALIAISMIGSLIGLVVDHKYIGLLGLFPIYFGLRGLVRLFKNERERKEEDAMLNTKTSSKVLSVAAVTFANGGDNIGIYVPLFATLMPFEKVVMVCVFLVMVAVWCVAASYLCKHPAIAKALNKYGHIVTPLVLVLLGVYILLESGTFTLFQ